MTILARPEDLIVEVLRSRLTDPRSRHLTESNSFTATAGQTTFILAPTGSNLVRCINSVKVNAVTLEKWVDYSIDLEGKKIILITPSTIGDAVIVSFKSSASGDEWIYPGYPIATMNAVKFPRISVLEVNKSATRQGNYHAPMWSEVSMQIDVWTKKDYYYTVGSKRYEDQDLADYLAYLVEAILINNLEDDVNSKLFNYSEGAFQQMTFEKDEETFRHMQEFKLSGTNIGQ